MNASEHPAVQAVWEEMGRVLEAGGEQGIPGGAPVTVSWSDLHAILCLLETREIHPASTAAEWICNGCGHGQGLTVMIPSEVWAEITPFPGSRGGVLCLWCMDRLAAEKGIAGPVEGTAHFHGKVIMIGNPLLRALAEASALSAADVTHTTLYLEPGQNEVSIDLSGEG